jgi:hypothetical protein
MRGERCHRSFCKALRSWWRKQTTHRRIVEEGLIRFVFSKLEPIDKFVRAHNQRHGFKGNLKRVILYKHEAAQVEEYREKLTQALAEFGVNDHQMS